MNKVTQLDNIASIDKYKIVLDGLVLWTSIDPTDNPEYFIDEKHKIITLNADKFQRKSR